MVPDSSRSMIEKIAIDDGIHQGAKNKAGVWLQQVLANVFDRYFGESGAVFISNAVDGYV